MVRGDMVKVLAEYESARSERFPRHPLAKFLREDFPKHLESLLAFKTR